MLKSLLLSGWFRVRPFFKYVVVAIAIAPLVAASAHTTPTKQSIVTQVAPTVADGNSVSATVDTVVSVDVAQALKAAQLGFLAGESGASMSNADGEMQVLQADKVESWAKDGYLVSSTPARDPLAAVELAPSLKESELTEGMSASQTNLIQKLKASKTELLVREANGGVLVAARTSPALTPVVPDASQAPVEPDQCEVEQKDPICSSHPIPWKWIQATQEAIGSKGGGVRYYRSLPVVSPDGRYAAYSRVQLEVKPEMHNSRVTSVMFIEDRQTGRLRVMTSTSAVSDPLLKVNVQAEDASTQGTIGVLVPVSWSQSGDRFLARRFEGILNTADATDHAVIWDRQKNHINTVTPSQEQKEHDIAILLGWSKNQPQNVLFQAGEMGEEDWPVLSVAIDGKTNNAPEDKPVTYGQKVSDVWSGPQVATR
jgi:hypothetical protein